MREMKSLLFTGLAAATVVSASATAGIVPGDTITLSRLGTLGLAVRYDYDSRLVRGLDTEQQAAAGVSRICQ